MTIKRLHRYNAVFLLLFIVAHITNHVIGLVGIENHIATMGMLRVVYRVQVIEITVIILFFSQIALGLGLILKRGKPRGRWAWIQAISGVYIAFFLLQHLSAVIMMRLTYAQLDTSFYWAASVVQANPMGWYFFPYYAFGIMSIFAHLAAAIHFRWPDAVILRPVLLASGVVFGLAIPVSLIGRFYEVSLPQEYLDYLRDTYPSWLATQN
jgi:hypothetical protein